MKKLPIVQYSITIDVMVKSKMFRVSAYVSDV